MASTSNKPDSSPPIAGGASFLGGCQSSFIPEDFSADEQLMIETADEFSRNEVLPVVERLDAQEDGLMPSLIKQAGQLGFCGPDTPEADGGLGLSKNLSARMLEHLSLNGSFSVTIGITSGISQVGLVLFGTPEQRSRFLPRLASGEVIGAYALSEPDSGSDALSLTTKAVKHGSTYRLTGTKMWISNAKWADIFLVMAKVDGQLAAFLVERDTPGLTVAREEHKMGLKGSSTARIVLEEAEVPEENLLHEVGLGHQVALNALNIGRFKLASMSLGPARDAIGIAARYVQERKQFGQLISRFGLIQHKFAMMAGLFFAAESATYRTGALVDGAFEKLAGTIEGNRKAAEEYAIECSMAKVFSTEVEALIVDEALQCFGGYGFTEEFSIARHYRDARVSKIYEGTNEINRLFMADRLLKRIQDGRASAEVKVESFVSELLGKLLALELKNPDKDNQLLRGAIADLMMATYAEQSARLRSDKLGGFSTEAYNAFLAWINTRSALSYQVVTGEELTLPAVRRCDTAGLAEAIYANSGPL